MISALQHLKAEYNTVEQFLRETPEESLIERNTWLSRLKTIEARISAEEQKVAPARSAITFAGPPVVGSHGVASAFGMAATRAYTKIVQVVAAQWYRAQPLSPQRPLKADSIFDLLVVGPAYGSFGFELEEPSSEQLTIEERSLLTQASEKTQLILQGALESDEELAQTIDDLDERTLLRVRAFLKILGDNDATCALRSGQREFRFESSEQVARARTRLETRNIRREEIELEGVFEGLLPAPRTFQFRRADTGEVVIGKVFPEVADIAQINQNLGQRARVRALSQQVGSAKPRLALIQNPQWL